MQFPRPGHESHFFSPELRRRLAESDRRWRVTLALRLVSSLFSLIGFSLFAAAIPTWNKNFFHVDGPSHGDWQDGMPIAALLFAFLYNILTTLHLFLRAHRKPLHPLLPLIADFLVWALLIPAVTFAIWGGLFRVWRPAIPDADGNIVCGIWNVFARDCTPVLYTVGGLELGGVVFASLVWALHFALFILAAIDLHRRRRAAALPRGSRFHRRNFIELDDNPPVSLPPQYLEHAAPRFTDQSADPPRAKQANNTWGRRGSDPELKMPERVVVTSTTTGGMLDKI